MQKAHWMVIAVLSLGLGLSACQKRDTDTAQQDQTTSPTSMDEDKK